MAETTPDPMAEMLAAIAPLATATEPPIDPPTTVVDEQLANLPTYARGLLRISVPVTVTLASQRKAIHEIIELGPGSIVKFDKTCDEPLELSVGNRIIATGEVVKVGDKFGLRIGEKR